jgi:hypothetical protein
MNKCAAHVPLHLNMPNGTTIQSSHTSELLLSTFPPHARQAHILPGVVHNSLFMLVNYATADATADATSYLLETRLK